MNSSEECEKHIIIERSVQPQQIFQGPDFGYQKLSDC